MHIEILNPALKDYRFVLASQSPRRQALLQEFGLPFTVDVRSVEEVFDESLTPGQMAVQLAVKKASAFPMDEIPEKTIVITADTVVAGNERVLGKPENSAEAKEMLRMLSGRSHEVITGVNLKSRIKEKAFSVSTKVFFKELSEDEVDYYVSNYEPLDKAGAYGIQEWIGFAGITRIEGSYFNVVGLPVHALYEELKSW